MKEKSPIEKNAERKQIDLLSEALNGASNANGYWLNASGKGYPKFHPRGVSVSPFNALFMALHSDKNGCGSNLFIHYNEAKAMGMSVREHERGVPFLFYNWNRYVNRNNPEEIISRTAYLGLDEQDRKHYKGVHNREVRTLFNIDQTTLQDVDRPSYEAALRQYGGVAERGYTEADNRKLRGLTQEELAERIDRSPAFVGHVEAPNIKKAVSLDTLFAIAQALDVPTYRFLIFDDSGL